MIEFINENLYTILSYCGISRQYYNSLPSITQSKILSYIYSRALSNNVIDAYIIRTIIL